MSAQSAQAQGQGQTIDLSSLPLQQLNQVKNQLNTELQHLTSSFAQLKSAQSKFRDCSTSVRDGLQASSTKGAGEGSSILVPLTPSLYVPGTLASTETVLVDVGTGFYLEKTTSAAQEFYKRKIDELGRNLVDLEKIVQGKQGNLAVVEDVLRKKLLEQDSKAPQPDAGDS